jgi:hypothetical protein
MPPESALEKIPLNPITCRGVQKQVEGPDDSRPHGPSMQTRPLLDQDMIDLDTLCTIDYAAWAEHRVPLLRAGRSSELDVEHLLEELSDMGKSGRRELESMGASTRRNPRGRPRPDSLNPDGSASTETHPLRLRYLTLDGGFHHARAASAIRHRPGLQLDRSRAIAR